MQRWEDVPEGKAKANFLQTFLSNNLEDSSFYDQGAATPSLLLTSDSYLCTACAQTAHTAML